MKAHSPVVASVMMVLSCTIAVSQQTTQRPISWELCLTRAGAWCQAAVGAAIRLGTIERRDSAGRICFDTSVRSACCAQRTGYSH